MVTSEVISQASLALLKTTKNPDFLLSKEEELYLRQTFSKLFNGYNPQFYQNLVEGVEKIEKSEGEIKDKNGSFYLVASDQKNEYFGIEKLISLSNTTSSDQIQTIKIEGPSKIFKLGREVYKGAQIRFETEKKNFALEALTNLDWFDLIKNPYQLIDCLTLQTINMPSYSQIEPKMYILISGEISLKNDISSKILKQKDIFGDECLYFDRRPTYKLKTNQKVNGGNAVLFSLDKKAFERVFGTLEELMVDRQEEYNCRKKEFSTLNKF